MLPAFGDEFALTINAKTDIVKKLLDSLLAYGAMEVTDEKTFYIRFPEDCIGSQTRDAARMRNKKKDQSENISLVSENFSPKAENFPPEKEIEKSRDREEKDTSALFFKKKSGSVNVQNANFQNESTAPEHNSAACCEPPRNYEIEAFLQKNNLNEKSSLSENKVF